MIQFYAPDILATGVLPEDESAHCVRVLRKREGDMITVFDGMGHRYTAVITDAHQRHTTVQITDCADVPKCWPMSLTLCVAPTKNADRMEWLFEKAVEIGVDRIVLMKCEHSERKVIKTDRLRKIIVSAAKQSLKAVVPELTELLPYRKALELCGTCEDRFVAYCDADTPRESLARVCRAATDTAILIGPEGDFSQAEIKEAVEAGFRPVTFGENRLRTETAALYGLTALHVAADMET